ncbi:hypothetical protein AWW67_18035 [Roseivirga seohaensis]|uniref:Uncharacterized protein n=1 Tax=Roseivirga seohaensis TaxID=1914963 RepID=A0A150Y1S7_9BACT|nr:hypothetical protein [Roseivirga seohaensis]KYG84886.1 hypothetical protein AWW67_18035 [Roseivirga seohaensis]
MEERKLEVLRFFVSPKDNKNEKLPLYNVEGIDLFDNLFTNLIPFIDDLPPDERNKRIVQFGKTSTGATVFHRKDAIRSVSGIIETGKYGKEENVVDINRKKDDLPVFRMMKNHALQKPFFFLICISSKKNEGLIFLEREGLFGIKQVFTLVLSKYISKNFPEKSFHFSNFIDDKFVKKFINEGVYNKIRLVRNSLPEDVAEKYGLEKFNTDDFVLELSIRSKGKRRIGGSARKRIQEIFENNPNGFFTSDDFKKIGFDDEASIHVNSTYKNSSRTINLSDTLKFRPYYDIKVNITSTGHSDFKSIEGECIQLLEDFNLDLY